MVRPIQLIQQATSTGGFKASVFKTEYGVVWANKTGCYYYDGRKINDLLQKRFYRLFYERLQH
jgi:hypothetical protein